MAAARSIAAVVATLLCLSLAQARAAAATRVLVTVDTETSSGCSETGCFPPPMSADIFGIRDGRSYGIPLMMDMLEARGMRGTFFVNAFLDAHYPEPEVAAMVAGITRRGHDVQLHTHAEFLCFRQCPGPDLACRRQCIAGYGRMAGTPFDHQLALLRQGAANIERWSGRFPVAFRGGAYDADAVTLAALGELGIGIDSSLSGPAHRLARVLPVNRPALYDGVLEVPLFTYRENLVLLKRDRHLDLESSTLAEQKYLLGEAARLGIDPVVVMMHSFSFCRKDWACPNTGNIERFGGLLDYLRDTPGMKVATVREFWQESAGSIPAAAGPGPVPEIGYGFTLYRSVVRFNDGWKNRAFVLAHVAALAAFAALVAFLARRARRRAAAAR